MKDPKRVAKVTIMDDIREKLKIESVRKCGI